LIGWQVSNLLGLSFGPNLYLSEALVGALVGLCVGLCIGITEGVMTRNLVQAAKSGVFSGLFCMVAGAIGLPLSEFFFQTVAGYFGRGPGLGAVRHDRPGGESFKPNLEDARRLHRRAIGGLLLEAYAVSASSRKAAGLVLLGASVGAFISLVEVALGKAWLEVTSGKLRGTEFMLDKFMHAKGPSIAIGSSPLKSEIVLPDPDIAPQHAMLRGDGSQFTVKDMSLSGTFINNRKVEQARLSNGQRIRMGNTELVYHEKR
jgi:hypothetical protein